MNSEPLSARLLTMGDDLHQLARMIAPKWPELSSALICHAARTGLASVAAQALERQLRRHDRALQELHADAAEEAAQAEAATHAADPPPNPARQATIDAIRASLPRLIR